MTDKPAKVLDALLARMETLEAGSPPLPVSWPDLPFDPPEDGRYLDVSFLPNRPMWEGLSDGRMDQGLLQVTVVTPKGHGAIAALEIAGEVMAHFAKGTLMTSGDVTVKVNREPWHTQPYPDPDALRTPVLIPWTA